MDRPECDLAERNPRSLKTPGGLSRAGGGPLRPELCSNSNSARELRLGGGNVPEHSTRSVTDEPLIAVSARLALAVLRQPRSLGWQDWAQRTSATAYHHCSDDTRQDRPAQNSDLGGV